MIPATKLAVNIGVEILKLVPGRISTEVDAVYHSIKNNQSLKPIKLVRLYKEAGVDKSRILIKLASTREGICAAKELRKKASTVT